MHQKHTVDTAVIVDEYMKRPINLMCVGFGAWFNSALNLRDAALERMEGQQAKLYISNAGYNIREGLLDLLKDYNTTRAKEIA